LAIGSAKIEINFYMKNDNTKLAKKNWVFVVNFDSNYTRQAGIIKSKRGKLEITANSDPLETEAHHVLGAQKYTIYFLREFQYTLAM
jgi:hypothetical protein